jgi:hypothetical protein
MTPLRLTLSAATLLISATAGLKAQGPPIRQDSGAREARPRRAEERTREKPSEREKDQSAVRPARGTGRGEAAPAPEQLPDRTARTAHPVRGAAGQPSQPQPQPQPVPAATGPAMAGNRRTPNPVPRPIEGPRPGERVAHTPSGTEIRRGPTGEVHEIQSRGMVIRHAPEGVRVVTVVRPDRTVIVTNRAGHGYIERPFEYRNAELIRRTYYVNGAAYGRVYRPYLYRGVAMDVYMPSRYYAPAFYGWVYTPWVAPVRYTWGWGTRPWYGYYGGYFAPYPVYPSASLWLTDYVIASTLETAYQERLDASVVRSGQTNDFGATPLSPEAKQAVADEVRRQLALESAESRAGLQTAPDPGSSGIARMLSDNTSHAFVVARALEVRSGGGECQLTEGDVIQLAGQTPYDATSANAIVLASKGVDCAKGSAVAIPLADLQDMQNHMRETIDRGLTDLQAKQGGGGLPPAPLPAMAAPVQPEFAALAPPVDPNGGALLAQQAQAADSTERDALNQGPPRTITLGQTIDSVVKTLGTPKSIVDLGEKKIYVYSDLKITFMSGKVTDVQ